MRTPTHDSTTVIARFGHNSGLEIEVIAFPRPWGYTVVSKGAGWLSGHRHFLNIEDVFAYASILETHIVRTGFINLD